MIQASSFAFNLLETAKKHPERCAIQQGRHSISYASLARRAAALGKQLRESGLSAGDRVAIALPSSITYAVSFYGVLMAGGIAVPLNVAARAAEFSLWLNHSGADFVLLESPVPELERAIRLLPVAVTVLQVGEAELFEIPALHFQAVDDPACIFFTSGTTGQPKAVTLSHGNLDSNTRAIVEYLGLTSDDSVVNVLPLHYAYGSSVLHTHLRVGARVILERGLVYPHTVVELLARERATGFSGVPSTFALLLSRVSLADHDLSALRYVTQAGGHMSPADAQRLQSALPATDIIIMYGQTEATARLTWLPPNRLGDKAGSVGIPIPGVSIQIRDEAEEPIPAGAVGNIWVRGPNVMLGYWRDEVASRRVKREDWLNTGDMGRLDNEGFLYVTGRRSDMIKAGAHRIHPQEIEEVIAEMPGVQEAAVTGIDDYFLGQAVKAFVVVAEGARLTEMQVQAHCRHRMADYKTPKAVELVERLPRTASGKICRSALNEGDWLG